jgi:hypothetical protein
MSWTPTRQILISQLVLSNSRFGPKMRTWSFTYIWRLRTPCRGVIQGFKKQDPLTRHNLWVANTCLSMSFVYERWIYVLIRCTVPLGWIHGVRMEGRSSPNFHVKFVCSDGAPLYTTSLNPISPPRRMSSGGECVSYYNLPRGYLLVRRFRWMQTTVV